MLQLSVCPFLRTSPMTDSDFVCTESIVLKVVQHVLSSSWEMVTVTLGSEHYTDNGKHSALDDFHEL
ncbi:hypothetical protein NECAME_19666, partial [Necator americanus]